MDVLRLSVKKKKKMDLTLIKLRVHASNYPILHLYLVTKLWADMSLDD